MKSGLGQKCLGLGYLFLFRCAFNITILSVTEVAKPGIALAFIAEGLGSGWRLRRRIVGLKIVNDMLILLSIGTRPSSLPRTRSTLQDTI